MADKQPTSEEFSWDDYRYEVIPTSKLFVDKEYQRRPTSLVKEIGANFKPHLVNTLCVSARKESGSGENRKVTSGAVFDGQQRLEGARLAGVVVLPCVVYLGLNQADEARLFAELQMSRRGVASYDRFRAALIAGDAEALAIQDIAESAGYEIGYSGASHDTISAVRALEMIYRHQHQGVVVLERTLVLFKEAWKRNYIPSAWHLRGMGMFLQYNPEIDDDRLIRRLFITSPSELEKRARAAQELGGTAASAKPMMEAIRAVYSIREQQVERKLKAVS